MMLSWEYLCDRYEWRTKITGVVHCGAHTCEEASRYAELGVPVWWIEANPNLRDEILANLAPYPDQHLIEALLYDRDGEQVTLHLSGPDYRGSSSILEWGSHRNFSPLVWVDHVTLPTRTLDSLWEEHGFPKANLLTTDLQGADGLVLSAAGCLLEQMDWVMCEANVDEVYQKAMLLPELDALLAAVDPGPPFERVETYIVPGQGWGDVAYRRMGQ